MTAAEDLAAVLDVLVQGIAAADGETSRLLASCQRCRNRLLYLLDHPAAAAGYRMLVQAIAALRLNHDVCRRGSQHVTGQDRNRPRIRRVMP
jgi:hypothetical protein